ncbi:MAG: phosphoenolpyruvate synthase [Lentisphaerae bacterium]|nr:phosphoenolpyruvate synthase [Lentisphaerota bacterium]
MQLEEPKQKRGQAAQPPVAAPQSRQFHALMARRVKTILMVSTPYEAFSLSWDGSLTEDIYGAYSLLHLQNVPQITTVTSGREALATLAREKYDLVLVSSNLADLTIADFAQAVKTAAPGLPVVVLIFALGGSPGTPLGAYGNVDYVFSWQGSAKVLLAIIKLVEDALNIDQDIRICRIGVILMIEDSIKHYSFFLSHLYALLMKQAFARVPYGIDENERQLHTRTRPKIVLARTFAEAETLVERYKPFLHGVISDLQVAAEGRKDLATGPAFLRRLLESLPGLPVMLMSADEAGQAVARALSIGFVDKNSPQCLRQLEDFCISGLGFGDFIFRDSHGHEIARARNLREFENALSAITDESLEFHSRRNQFSHWLLAQGEAALAELIRPVQAADFKSLAEMRAYLSAAVRLRRREKHRGIIADFRADDFEPEYAFLMTGRGGLGGKARGLAFMFNLFSQHFPDGRLGPNEIKFPHTLVITTDAFDEFMALNDLEAFAAECRSDEKLRARFMAARLPEGLLRQLRAYIAQVQVPLAVRSSSHMEDSSNQPFAGLYQTCMIPNHDPDAAARLDQLGRAVKLVYASVFTTSVKRYFQTLKLNTAEEKMAVIVQELVGRRYGDLFYPAISGVAQSFNYYPFAAMEAEDGVAATALGFGKMVVEGGQALRFCPRYPTILPQAATTRELRQISQKQFYALSLSNEALSFAFGKGSDLRLFKLERAEQDQTLHPVASVISEEDDLLVDDLGAPGERVVTFAPILKRNTFPLCDILNELLKVGKASIGSDVEIEFAANIDFQPGTQPEFYLLQIRPMVTARERLALKLEARRLPQALCASRKIMGNGLVEDVHDIIYCHPERFDLSRSRPAAAIIGRLNQALSNERRRYVLIGPGRWGTRVASLGVPVNWQQVSGAAVIIETAARGKRIDLSQGAHFFHNLAATGIGYFSITETDQENFVRWERLEQLPVASEEGGVRHVRSPEPLSVFMDALNHRGVIMSSSDVARAE